MYKVCQIVMRVSNKTSHSEFLVITHAVLLINLNIIIFGMVWVLYLILTCYVDTRVGG